MKKTPKPPVIPRLSACWQSTLVDHATALAWSPDGRWLAACASTGPITLWEASTGKLAHILPGHGFGTLCLAWASDSKHLASGGQDGMVRIWDPEQGLERVTLNGGAPWVEQLAWSPKEPLLATAAGKYLQLWTAHGELRRSFLPLESTITGVAWHGGGRLLAVSCYGGVRCFTPESSERVTSFDWKGSLIALAWSPTGKYIATGCQDAAVHVWNALDGQDVEMSGYDTKVRELAWDAAGRFLATGGGPQPAVWDFSGKGPAGRRPIQLEAHEVAVTALAFQGKRPVLASGDRNGVLLVWELPKGGVPIARAEQSSEVTCLAWSPQTQRLAVAGASGEVTVWSLP